MAKSKLVVSPAILADRLKLPPDTRVSGVDIQKLDGHPTVVVYIEGPQVPDVKYVQAELRGHYMRHEEFVRFTEHRPWSEE